MVIRSPISPLVSKLLYAVIFSLAFNFGTHAAPATTKQRNDSQTAPCDCDSHWREYTTTPTPAIRTLWLAANQGDEATFAAELSGIKNINDYAVAGQPLLHALLSPDASKLSEKVYWEMSPAETEAITTAHRNTWAAKERMLALALQHQINWKDVSYQSRMPALHLAAAYGSPHMVELLLDAGADPDQINYDKGRRLLTFLLEGDEFAQRLSHLPLALQTAEERNLILREIIKATKQEPFSEFFDPANPGDTNTLSPAYWRYSMWKGLILDPDIETKTLVAMNDKGWGPVALTGEKGLYNPLRDAVASPDPSKLVTIQTLLPRFFTDPSNGKLYDLWLDAACQAVYTRPAAVFTLVDAQTSWSLTNVEAAYTFQPKGFIEKNDENIGMTLAEHIVFAGKGWLLEALTTLYNSAAVNQDQWVTRALQGGQAKLAQELLQKGYAAPVLNLEQQDSPYYQALISAIRNNELLLSDYLLSHLTTEMRSKLVQADDNLLNHLGRSIAPPVEGQEKSAPPDVLPMAKMLVSAGATPKSMDSSTLFQLLYEKQAPTVIWLLEQGAPADEAQELINAAIQYRQNAALPALFKTAAAQALLSGEHGRQWLIQAYQQADSATISFLEQAGVNLSASDKLQAAAYRGDSDWLREVHAQSGGSLETYCLYAYQLDLNQLLGRDDLLLALEAIGVKRIAFCDDDTASLPTLLTLKMLSSETFTPVFNRQERSIISKRLQKILALDHNAVDSSALQQAVLTEREDILGILLEAGVRDGSIASDPAAPNTKAMPAKSKSALAEAIDIGAATSAKLLLQYGQTLRAAEQAHYACALNNPLFAAIGLKLPACIEPDRSLQKTLLGTWKLKSQNGNVAILKLDDKSEFSLSQFMGKSLYSQSKGKWLAQGEQLTLTFSEIVATHKVKTTSLPGPDRGLVIEFSNLSYEISQPPKVAVYDGQSTQTVSMNTTENKLELKGNIQGLAFWNGERWSMLTVSPALAANDHGTLRVEYEDGNIEQNRQVLLQIGSGKKAVLRLNNQEFNRATLN